MKTQVIGMFGMVVAFGLAVFACAAPVEDPESAAAQPGEESTGESSAALMNNGGATDNCSGASCKSDTGDQSCCCAVGDRCVKTVGTCKCEKATVIGGGGGGIFQRIQ